MSKNLQKRRKQILAEIEKIVRLSQGSISEQYYIRTAANGKKYKQGPYYILTCNKRGRERRVRISREELPRIEKELQNYQQAKALFQELLDITETLTQAERGTTENKRRKIKKK